MDTQRQLTLTFGLDEPMDDSAMRARAAKSLGVAESTLPEVRVLRRSIDARQRRVRFVFTVSVGGHVPTHLGGAAPRDVSGARRVVIVGDGPAGLFCAYELARAGVRSLVLDRGKQVQPRRHDLKQLNVNGTVDPESNYCFGEGGAGTYSDGKLYTRAHKRGDVRDILEILATHGAPESILVDARPHIGSNRLPEVVTALREHLEQVGVEFRFGARVTDLELEAGRVAGVVTADERVGADSVVIATGHSARDVLVMLDRHGVTLEPKAFALGVRIEHPQPLIDRIQYGQSAGHRLLPAAAYRLARDIEDRGVFSFCMCPGGFVVPASTDVDGLVINGMSLSRRDSPFANSGLVVAIEPSDVEAAGFPGALGGLDLQRTVERAALAAGGGSLRAPATRVTDFIAARGSSTLPDSSYRPGLAGGDISEVLAASGLDLADKLRRALSVFGRNMRGYVTEEATLIATESRTSSAVRVARHPTTLESEVPGLYPCGEGAGYAGGIVSAAMDGIRVARAITTAWSNSHE